MHRAISVTGMDSVAEGALICAVEPELLQRCAGPIGMCTSKQMYTGYPPKIARFFLGIWFLFLPPACGIASGVCRRLSGSQLICAGAERQWTLSPGKMIRGWERAPKVETWRKCSPEC